MKGPERGREGKDELKRPMERLRGPEKQYVVHGGLGRAMKWVVMSREG